MSSSEQPKVPVSFGAFVIGSYASWRPPRATKMTVDEIRRLSFRTETAPTINTQEVPSNE